MKRLLKWMPLVLTASLVWSMTVCAAGISLKETRTASEEMQGEDLPVVAGTEYVPTKSQKDCIKKQTVPTDLYEPLSKREQQYKNLSEDAFNSMLFMLGKTADYRIYFTPDCDSLVIAVPGGKFVKLDTYFTNTGLSMPPRFAQADFDGDGVQELMFTTIQLHGMGYTWINVEGLFVVDKDAAGKWKIYHAQYDATIGAFRKAISAEKDGKNLYMKLNGNRIPKVMAMDGQDRAEEFSYCVDSYLGYFPAGNKILAEVAPYVYGFRHDAPLPAVGYGNYNLNLEIKYLGAGQFAFGDFSMRDTTAEMN